MAAEDEAVQLAFRTGTAAVQSASEIIKYLLEGLAQARRARAAGNRNDRIPARFARALTHGAANAIDGHGEKGIVSADEVDEILNPFKLTVSEKEREELEQFTKKHQNK